MPSSALSADAIRALVRAGESPTVEFKLALPPERVIAADLAAFANVDGGVLLVGINEKGEIVGLAEGTIERTVRRLRRVAESLLPQPTTIGHTLVDGKQVVYAIVDPAPSSYRPILTAKGEVYQRTGSTSLHVPREMLEAALHAPRHVAAGRQLQLFVAMSFHAEEEPALEDYFAAMKRAVVATNLPIAITRIDLQDGDYEISQRIMDEIDRADIVIADFTLTPPNVYFELGYARGKGKRVIQTARKATRLEFDVRNWRTEFYRNATELEQKLDAALRAAYAELTGQP